MKKHLSLFVILFLTISSILNACAKGCPGGDCGTCSGKTEFKSDGSEENPLTLSEAAISTASLEALLKSKVPMMLIDCRSGDCVDGECIPGATLLPDTSSDDDILKTIPDKNMLIVLYAGYKSCCAPKDMRKRLQTLGYTNIVDYPPGIRGWIAAGKSVQKVEIKDKK